MKTATAKPYLALIEKHNLTLTSSAPTGIVKDKWPCIQYQCTLSKDGREIWSGEFSLGVGHVKIPERKAFFRNMAYHGLDKPMFVCLANGKTPADHKGHAEFAAGLAKIQKVTPFIESVLSSLLLDGSAYFDAETFEGWCGNFGYDADSRKAEAIFKACDDIGRKLSRAFSADDLTALREAFQDY